MLDPTTLDLLERAFNYIDHGDAHDPTDQVKATRLLKEIRDRLDTENLARRDQARALNSPARAAYRARRRAQAAAFKASVDAFFGRPAQDGVR